MKMFRVPREENHEVDIVAKLTISEIVKMPMNVLIKVGEVPCTKRILINTIKERED